MTKRLLICTDLDRTLLPNGKQPESSQARTLFNQLVMRDEVTLAYVSGRHRQLVEEAIHEYALPSPDWVIGDVGTTLYQVQAGVWQHNSAWEQHIGSDWQGLAASDLAALLSDIPALCLQEAAKQNRYKLSYYLPLEINFDTLRPILQQRLDAHQLAASLIYSIDEAAAIGLLDVLPLGATKLHAVEYLMQQQGFSTHNTVFAGDSGNDLPVLTSSIPAVLVANACSDIIAQANALALQHGTLSALYVAQGGFLGMNGNYGAGILEGIAHYHPDTLFWMEENHDH